MFLLALFLFQAPPNILELTGVDKNPYVSAADVAQGKKLYAGRCAGCHGPTGDGGKGANLALPVLSRAPDDLALYRVIRYGLQDTEMPGSLMAPREIWQVAAFVRTLGRSSQPAPSGDARRGGLLVRGKAGCLQCHAIGAEGGLLGPALGDAGLRRSHSYLRAKLLDPTGDIPETFRMVDLRTNSGQQISGVRLNEDTWSIQVRDHGNRLHSFWKPDLKELKVEQRTVMPSYRGKLSDQELNDMVAYLASLRGEQ